MFALSENKFITVADLFSRGFEQGGEAWQWRRRLWAWEEEELEECRTLLLDVLCMLMFQTSGFGYRTLLNGTQFADPISC